MTHPYVATSNIMLRYLLLFYLLFNDILLVWETWEFLLVFFWAKWYTFVTMQHFWNFLNLGIYAAVDCSHTWWKLAILDYCLLLVTSLFHWLNDIFGSLESCLGFHYMKANDSDVSVIMHVKFITNFYILTGLESKTANFLSHWNAWYSVIDGI